jgi:hypothetical protein
METRLPGIFDVFACRYQATAVIRRVTAQQRVYTSQCFEDGGEGPLCTCLLRLLRNRQHKPASRDLPLPGSELLSWVSNAVIRPCFVLQFVLLRFLYMASNVAINWREFGRNLSCLSRCCSHIWVEGMRTTTKIINSDRRCSCPDSNQASPRSVSTFCIVTCRFGRLLLRFIFYHLIHKWKLKDAFLPHCIWSRCGWEQQLAELLQVLSRAKLSSSLPANSIWFASSVLQFPDRVYRP